MEGRLENPFDKIKYLSHFIVRAFLLAILCFIAVLGFVFCLYFGDILINSNNPNYKSPLFNGYVIVSQSMVPTININDAIIVKRVDHDKYKVGDIISFSSSDTYYKGLTVTHRVINKENVNKDSSIYTTKGDNNPVADYASVATNQIYGKVLFVIPKIGYVHSFLSKPSNFLYCFLIPIGIVILYDTIKITVLMSKRRES